MREHRRIINWEDTIAELVKDSVSLALGVFDDTGTLLDANDAMCVLLHTTPQELSPSNFFVNPSFTEIGGKDNTVVFEGLLTIGNYSDTSYVLSSKIYRKGNFLLVMAEVDIKQLFDENKMMSELNREVNNLQRQLIKEKKKLQFTLEELKETQQQLVHSEKMNAMGHLVAGVAHELNNPLSFVANNIFMLDKYSREIIASYNKVELYLQKNSEKEHVEQFRKIKEEDEIDYLTEDILEVVKETKIGVSRATKIVEDLRTFSRHDESEMKEINLIDNINSTLSILRSEIQKKDIEFCFHYTNEIELSCYPGQLNQAIFNVLINAIYAVPKAGKIELFIDEDETFVCILVKDNGCGIAEEDLKKIFNPFFTTKPVGTGTGLGLSITYKIIATLHNGNVTVKSDLENGTEVNFEIPKLIAK